MKRQINETGQTSVEEITDTPREYAVDRIVHQVGEGDNVQYVLLWYGYTAIEYST